MSHMGMCMDMVVGSDMGKPQEVKDQLCVEVVGHSGLSPWNGGVSCDLGGSDVMFDIQCCWTNTQIVWRLWGLNYSLNL